MVEAGSRVTEEVGDDLRWYLLQKKIKEGQIKRSFELFRESGIEPILIKGWATALYYPPDVPRYFTDIDLAASSDDFARAKKLAFSDHSLNVSIDIHRELRHLDTLDWDDLFRNSRLVEIDGVDIRILRPEDHLRVICVHWLTDGGAYKTRLWDIYYAVANREPGFDWERCLGPISETRRRWVVCAIGLAHRYLDLSVDGLPFADEVDDIPSWITRCVEAEWKSDVRLEPVVTMLGDRKRLLEQIQKRIPPNPIRATVEMEGKFDDGTRVFYQAGSYLKMLPSVFGMLKAFLALLTRKND